LPFSVKHLGLMVMSHRIHHWVLLLKTAVGKILPLLGLGALESRLITHAATRRSGKSWQQVFPRYTCYAFDRGTKFKHKVQIQAM